MEKITVEIDIDSGLSIFGVVLKQQYLELYPFVGRVPMFSMDKRENEAEFDKLKEAFKLVMEYNGVDYE